MTGDAHVKISVPSREFSRARLRQRLFWWLVAIDSVCLTAGFYLTSLVYEPDPTERQWLLITIVLLPVYIAIAINRRAYAAEVIQLKAGGVTRAFHSYLLAAGAIILIAFYLKSSTVFSRVTFALGSALSLTFLAIARETFLSKARTFLGGNPYTVVVIADGDVPLVTEGAAMILMPGAGNDIDPDRADPEMFHRLALAVRDADRVVVKCPPERRVSWVRALKGANVRSEIISPELSGLAPLDVDHWNGATTLVVADGPLTRADRVIKRAFDMVVAVLAILVLSPLLLVAALIIKLGSRGPVLFVQTRIGQGNRKFQLLKFRSMRVDCADEQGHRSTGREDDRITPFGRFIRRTSIDELPQLYNVLVGDMSIVGPRPHALGSRAEDRLFWEIDERYWYRHAAKPGLTGLAQVRGYRGATVRESDLTDRLQADLEYLNHWSIWRDVKIVMTTFRVLAHRNAF